MRAKAEAQLSDVEAQRLGCQKKKKKGRLHLKCFSPPCIHATIRSALCQAWLMNSFLLFDSKQYQRDLLERLKVPSGEWKTWSTAIASFISFFEERMHLSHAQHWHNSHSLLLYCLGKRLHKNLVPPGHFFYDCQGAHDKCVTSDSKVQQNNSPRCIY